LALLLLAAFCVSGHLHRVLGQYALHDHHGHAWVEAAHDREHEEHDSNHQDSGRSGAEHFLAEHSAVAVVAGSFLFVPAALAAWAIGDEAEQRLPEAQPSTVEQPPRTV
jgi:hypothetical protein